MVHLAQAQVLAKLRPAKKTHLSQIVLDPIRAAPSQTETPPGEIPMALVRIGVEDSAQADSRQVVVYKTATAAGWRLAVGST